jgi:hypothetical protein
MMVIGLGEIFVVLIIRPLRFLVGGERTPIGRGILRFENWILRHLHIMGAESRMRHELDMHGQASSFLAEGMTDHSKAMPSIGDTLERVRAETGADVEERVRSSRLQEPSELGRGQRQVDSSGGDRSDDIQEAMLRAQREQNQRAARDRRHNLRRRR